jgi:single-stranded-DNA-specific exonuclease
MSASSPAAACQSEPFLFEDAPLPDVSGAASGRAWSLRDADPRAVSTMVQRLGLDPMLARVLIARGVNVDSAPQYLNPKLRHSMPDPYVMKDMEAAAHCIADAVLRGKGIGVFGDYDVDGTSAAALLKKYFDAIGVALPVHLPDRMMEGYGPSIEAFRSLRERGAEIIITVDCGAAAHDVVNAAAAEGLGVVILDHHLMDAPPPAGALATVNPNRPDDISGLENLSAAGVAFLAVVAVNRCLRNASYFKSRNEPDVTELLSLAALGLVCDVMAMTGFTRVLVAQGLKVMAGEANTGLSALAERAGAKGPPSVYHLGFLVGPRINAAGRIGHARLAFEALTTSDVRRRRDLVEKLHVMNAERQAIEAAVQQDALKKIETDGLDTDEIIVVAGEGWHPGVIGIVAGRVKEKYDKPVIVIGVDDGVGKGSGRSISDVDLGGAVSAARKEGLLIAGGGHAMAAGLSVAPDQIPAFRRRLNNELSEAAFRARSERTLSIDAVVGASAVTRSFHDMIGQAGPFGPGNPEPSFALCNVRVAHTKTVGENHLAATLKDSSGFDVRAIAFRAVGEPLGSALQSNERIHVVGKIRPDDWRGGDAGQLQISDVAPAI